MKQHLIMVVSLAVLGGLLLGMAPDAMAAHELVGASKCKSCHKKIGNPYALWQKTEHAKAYETLASPEAKKIAADKGLGDPQKEEACLKCHVTRVFLGNPAVNEKGKYTDAEGIGCEACHGPGSDYKKKKIMKDHDAAVANGLLRNKTEEHCTQCHNDESPTFEAFDFEKQWAEIDHPIIPKEKAAK